MILACLACTAPIDVMYGASNQDEQQVLAKLMLAVPDVCMLCRSYLIIRVVAKQIRNGAPDDVREDDDD